MEELKGKILAGKVLLEPFKAEEKTERGIIIPESAKTNPFKGKVVLTGVAKGDTVMEVKAGDVVRYSDYAGTEITINEKTYLLMDQESILYIY